LGPGTRAAPRVRGALLRLAVLLAVNLALAVPLSVLLGSVLPLLFKYTEPTPLRASVLSGIITAVLVTLLLLALEREGAREPKRP